MIQVPALMRLPARGHGQREGLASILKSSLHLPKIGKFNYFLKNDLDGECTYRGRDTRVIFEFEGSSF